MSNDVRETKFRVMITARVFSKKPEGTITQMFLDECAVGTLPNDNLDGSSVAFIERNGEPLAAAVALCLMRISQAKTEKEKKKAARLSFLPEDSKRQEE